MSGENHYFVLRHGKSKANEAGVICSSMERGILREFGLTDIGKEQALAAGEALAKIIPEGVVPLVYASPFSRAQETAHLAVEAFTKARNDNTVATVNTAPEIRERYFGTKLEGESDERYAEAWKIDAVNPKAPPGPLGESVAKVAERIRYLVDQIESQYKDKCVLFVAHGDTLQIAQVVFAALYDGGRNPTDDELRAHRSFKFGTGEWRKIESGSA